MISILHSLWSQRYFKYIISQESFITITALVRFLQIENTQLLMWHKILLFCEIQCHSGYIDMVSFQLFPNIIFKNTDIRDNAVTMAALIWILSSVYSQRVFKMSTICESFFTMVSLIWHSQCEFSGIFWETVLLWKPSHWLHLYIWLFPSVSFLMYFKTSFCCKSFITLAAFIWLLHNVSYLILLKWTHRNH